MKTLAEQYGEANPSDASTRIEHRLSQQEIGESVGLTRVSVNRLINQWVSDDLISKGRGYIVVHDFDRLEEAVLKGVR